MKNAVTLSATIVLCYIYPGTRISIRYCSLPPGNELHAPNACCGKYKVCWKLAEFNKDCEIASLYSIRDCFGLSLPARNDPWILIKLDVMNTKYAIEN